MNCHVLFVDDEPENLGVFEACFGDYFSVLTAGGAQEALALMRAKEVGVILADQRMPRTTGLELLAQAQSEFPHAVRLLITAYSDLDAAIDAINRGCVRRYLRKPWDVDELHQILREAVEHYEVSSKLGILERRLRETEQVYSLGVIAAGFARELRAPLSLTRSAIMKAQDRLHGMVVGESPLALRVPGLRPLLSEVEDELGEGLVGLGRALDVVRGIELPTLSDPKENVDPSEVLRLTLRLVQTELRRSASLEIDVQPVPEVSASSGKLGQVFLNLVVNAIHALREGPRGEQKLKIRLVPDKDSVVFEVRDSGPPIPPHVLPLVFDPLSAASVERRMGLGLAVSKAIIDDIGGRIEAENVASGVVFRVRMPVYRVGQASNPRPAIHPDRLSGADPGVVVPPDSHLRPRFSAYDKGPATVSGCAQPEANPGDKTARSA